MPKRFFVVVFLSILPALVVAAPVVREAWLRAAPPAAGVSAGYLTLDNSAGPGDAVTAVQVEGVQAVELHEMARDAAGLMSMHQVSEIFVPAGGRVVLAPGGLHLMLIGLDRPLVAGQKRRVVLQLRGQGDVVFEADVAGALPATH